MALIEKDISIEERLIQYLKNIKESIFPSQQEEFIETVSRKNIENLEIFDSDMKTKIDKENIFSNKKNQHSRIEKSLNFRKSYIHEKKRQTPEKYKNELDKTIFEANDKLIVTIGKEINRYVNLDNKKKRNKLLELKENNERESRVIQLKNPSNQEDFEASLMWIVEKVENKDINLIKFLRNNLPYSSDKIHRLLERVEEKINLLEDTRYKYRVFCSDQEALKQFNSEIITIDSYPEFTIISTSEQIFAQLKDLYPIELLESESVTQIEDNSAKEDIVMKYLVVEFQVPTPINWKKLIEDTGARVIQAAGRSKGIVSVDNEDIVNQIENLNQVKQVKNYSPQIKVQTQYLQKQAEQPVTKEEIASARLEAARNPHQARNKVIPIPGILIASFFTEADRDKAARDLEQVGIRIADKPGNTKLVLDVSTHSNPIDTIEIIRQQQGVRSLQEKIVPRLFNNVARDLIGENVIPSNPIPNDTSLGLTGEGEIVAVADTGLDTGNKETLHLDFEQRVEMIQSCPITAFKKEHIENFEDDDASDKYSGHGTHVAGSILGSGEQARLYGETSPPTGVAPKAKLIFQAIEKTLNWTPEGEHYYWQVYKKNPPRYGLFGIPDELKDLFLEAYNQGARIHSNSWGGGFPGDYDQKCLDLDEFIWNNKDFLVIVAAGNDGEHTFSGIQGIDQGSVTSPGVAKNCLTVGASENNREGQFLDTYGLRKPYNFPYPPFKDDNMVDCIDDIAAFSSRGPCEGGRRKPDVVAPGTFVLSTRSSQIPDNHFAEGYYSPAKNYYMYMSGTSMATPLVSGCAALVRQYLREKRNIKNPSAALVKATLIHSAQYMNYRYAHPISAPWADDEQGWGRVNLGAVLNPVSPVKVVFIDNSEGLATGDGYEYKVEIADDTVPLRATLVYTDFPGEEGSIEQLVNNLNLTLYPPSDKHRRYYQGNDFNNIGKIDNVNNVEGCIIEPAQVQTGVWTIKVVGSDVPEAPQDYALVVSGGNLKLLQDSQ